jgi:hypothetical protein
MIKVTPDRGHPVAQQGVLGACTVMAISLLLLTACSQAYGFSLPAWAWMLLEYPLIVLITSYAGYWEYPGFRRRARGPG